MNSTGGKIELFVKDVSASAEFYRRVLGFEIGETREAMLAGNLMRHTPLRRGPVLMGLGPLESLPTTHHLRRAGLEAERGIGVEVCLYVDDADLDACYERALRESPTPPVPLARRPWGVRDFRIIDPDGYYIRVSAPDADASWMTA